MSQMYKIIIQQNLVKPSLILELPDIPVGCMRYSHHERQLSGSHSIMAGDGNCYFWM